MFIKVIKIITSVNLCIFPHIQLKNKYHKIWLLQFVAWKKQYTWFVIIIILISPCLFNSISLYSCEFACFPVGGAAAQDDISCTTWQTKLVIRLPALADSQLAIKDCEYYNCIKMTAEFIHLLLRFAYSSIWWPFKITLMFQCSSRAINE